MEIMLNNPGSAWHALWLLPLTLGVVWLGRCLRRNYLQALIPDQRLREDAVAEVHPRLRLLRSLLVPTAIVCAILALLRIQTLPGETISRPARGRDVLVLLDVSRSMLATDVAPSRLAHAKNFVHELADTLRGDRFGLIAFAGVAFSQCPLTFNRSSFYLVLDDMDSTTIPLGGSNLEKALAAAMDAFGGAESPHRAIILLSDGEELQGSLEKALTRLRERNIPVHVIGLGDPDLGSFIQLPNKQLVQSKGKPVRTKLNEPALRRIAGAGNGLYVRSTPKNSGMDKIAGAIKSLAPTDQEKAITTQKPRERFQWPLGLAALLLLIRFFLGERRRISSAGAVAALLLFGALPLAAQESRVNPEIDKLRADIEAAYDIAEIARLHYNLGRKLQDAGNFEGAEKHYDAALASGGADKLLRGAAYQNLGVMLHNRARPKLKPEPAEAITLLKKAIKHYSEALRLRPDDRELAANFELAKVHLKTAIANLAIKKEVEQRLAQARKDAKQAKADQKKAEGEKTPGGKQKAALAATEITVASVERLVEAATKLSLEKEYVLAGKQFAGARVLQVEMLKTDKSDQRRKVMDHIIKGLKLLGVNESSGDGNNNDQKNPPKQQETVNRKASEMIKLLKMMEDAERQKKEEMKADKNSVRTEDTNTRNW